jgi:large subunit ribosomal protein L17
MRHKVDTNLDFSNKDRDHAKAVLRNLLTSFFIHKSLVTTQKKAKALAVYVDKLINVVNTKDKMNAIRFVSRYVFTQKSSLELFNNIAPKYKEKKS